MADVPSLAKAKTGIKGLDEITFGGLPAGRTTLVSGSAGCGKTILGIEFLLHGAAKFNEPGLFVAFEETPEELSANVRSLGFDLDALVLQKKLLVDFIHVEQREIEETGEYDLEGLFIRLGYLIDSIGAKRVVLDTIEVLFTGFSNQSILRSEIRRLFQFLKSKGVTAIVTAERSPTSLSRHGLEEFVSDCVIVLDHRVTEQISTRRLRVLKYRGSLHGTNEFPFLISRKGILVFPITSVGLEYKASHDRISTGIDKLDLMLGGKGLFRGSTVSISGSPGAGKTSLAAYMACSSCQRNEKCLYIAFEESADQMTRNMRSIGLDLDQWMAKGTLHFFSSRPTLYGLEAHLSMTYQMLDELQPQMIVLDPITTLTSVSHDNDAQRMLIRLIDFFKLRHATTILTSLSYENSIFNKSEEHISSLFDTWISLCTVEDQGEIKRTLHIMKSRGMSHSNKIKSFHIGDHGIDLGEPCPKASRMNIF